ncbi:glycoside hydrolase family 6 protein [Actinoplanes derwentensis]|uniref:Glucanase n=1 Tax=Actinoplanes derwentensis TaxID=113562 RepID=A0A1H2CJY1_9ACTN|nr:glycoside hydrolase family 6 protein [Actinoplanes derwentensis]GID82613.1 glucanase [Actinoplanes derwentensis]SDT70644.1 endoglucanase [Actinoplanes derwentensis]
MWPLLLAAVLGLSPVPALARMPAVDSVVADGLYVDPDGQAARYVRNLERSGRDDEAAIMRKIADQPAAIWFTDARAGFADRARTVVARANKAGKLPVLALYFIPGRDCRGYSAGGARTARAYRNWVSSIAGALRGRRALVILEPDAAADSVGGCLNEKDTATRLALLAYAVDTLRAHPGVAVYLDAGHPGWHSAARIAPALRRAGATRARGFSLNVANFQTTDANLRYGVELSRLLAGKHFVVDTSRNGNGPAPGQSWCNPPGRLLGQAPTLRTGQALTDGYLWIKRPGESDGACGKGAPVAGQWYPAYARSLTGS